MKKLFCMLLALAMSAAMVCGALAVTLYEPDEEDKDYTTAGWYKVYCIEPAGHDYVYIYDKPSSSKGDRGWISAHSCPRYRRLSRAVPIPFSS